MKAINQLTLQGDAYRGHAEEAFVLADEHIERAVRKQIIATLEKYIRKHDINAVTYVRRFYYFDQQAFDNDLNIFGLTIPGTEDDQT